MRGVFLFLLCALFAGCADTQDDTEPSIEAPVEAQYEDPDTGFQVDRPSLPREPPAAGERNFDEPPQWRLGEWWTYRITDHFEGNTYDVTRVVAGTEHGNYLVGFPEDAFSNDVMILHVPGYGDIKADDLSYDAHDVPYAPVQWPLVEGESWMTSFEALDNVLTFVVEKVDEDNGTALLTAAGGQGAGTFIYDVEMGEISRWISPGYADYEIVDHGYNYTGLVRVPHDHDLIFYHGRYVGLGDLSEQTLPPTLVAPIETITIEEGYDRTSFALILFDKILSQQAGANAIPTPTGYYSVKVTAPDGTVYEETLQPGDTGSVNIAGFGHDDPTGDWQLEVIAGGEGAAMIEGIGYHSIDIELPSGCVLASQNANHHQTLCDA